MLDTPELGARHWLTGPDARSGSHGRLRTGRYPPD
jgi:hypothetical protein